MKYYQQQDVLNMERINNVLEDLPPYMRSYVSYLSTGSTSKRTILNYVYDIRGFLRYIADQRHIDVKDVTPEILEQLNHFDFDEYFLHVDSYKRKSPNDKAIPTTNAEAGKARKLSSLRSLYNYQLEYGFIKTNPMASYKLRLKIPKPHITAMNVSEVNQVMEGVETGEALVGRQKKFAEKTRYRDTALLSLMLNTGIRVSECVGIDLDDIDWKNKKLTVHRKGGGNDPDVYLNDDAIEALQNYIKLERKPADPDERALFISRNGTRMAVCSVDRLVKKYTVNTVPGKKITPHKLRSTFGTNLYQATGDIHLTSKALNHSSIEVTASHYADVDLRQRKEAVEIIEQRYHEDSEN
jgi:integrase/recombinase XerC